MNKTVILDIDGVLADFEGKLVKVLGKEFGSPAHDYRERYRLEERFGNFPVILRRALELTADPNFYHDIQLCEGAVDFVETLLDDDYSIRYVSARPMSAYSFTRRWLVSRFTDVDINLYCGVGDKVDFIRKLNIPVDFIVEDSPITIRALKANGFVTVCWAQLWNEGIFPRLYVRGDGEIMLWANEAIEAEPFFAAEGEF